MNANYIVYQQNNHSINTNVPNKHLPHA